MYQGCSWAEGGGEVVQPPQVAEAMEWQNEWFNTFSPGSI
jgi:hypothetical protein